MQTDVTEPTIDEIYSGLVKVEKGLAKQFKQTTEYTQILLDVIDDLKEALAIQALTHGLCLEARKFVIKAADKAQKCK